MTIVPHTRASHRREARRIKATVVQSARDQGAVAPGRGCGREILRGSDAAPREQLQVLMGVPNVGTQLEVETGPRTHPRHIDHHHRANPGLHGHVYERASRCSMGRSRKHHRLPAPEVKREHDAFATVCPHDCGQGVEAGERFEPDHDPLDPGAEDGARLFRGGSPDIGQQAAPDAGETIEQRPLAGPAGDRVQVRHIALRAAEGSPEGAGQGDCIPGWVCEHRPHRGVSAAHAPLRPHDVPRQEIQNGDHAHRSTVGIPIR